MNLADLINGSFELFGCAAIAPSIIRSLRLKVVQGVHWATPTFFWSWGLWNIVYYPSLDQWFSFGAGLLVLFANTAWLYCVLKYTKHD